MITASPLTTSLADANSAELRRQAARRRAVADMQRELDMLEQAGPRRTRLRLMLAAAAAIAVALLSSSSAWAGTPPYYASPTGSTSADCTSAATACELQHAVGVASPGSEVILAPGTYNLPTELFVSKPLEIHGTYGQPAPTLLRDRTSCTTDVCRSSTALTINAASGSLAHLAIVQPGHTGGPAVALVNGQTTGGETLDEVRVEADSGYGITVYGSATLRDSSVWAAPAADFGWAIQDIAVADSPNDSHLVLDGASVVAPGAGQHALDTTSSCTTTCSISVVSQNSLLLGGSGDIRHYEYQGASFAFTATNSNYRSNPADRTIADATLHGNQTAPPQLVDIEHGDLHQLASSPTRDAGEAGAWLGTVDFDGDARVFGSAPDIGADE
jgi:hypothetical protein